MYSAFKKMVYRRVCCEENQQIADHCCAKPYEMSLGSIFFKVGLSWVIRDRNYLYHAFTTAGSPA